MNSRNILNSKNIWVLPLVGGIISLIALFTPTAYYSFSSGLLEYNEYSWMWGLLYAELYDYEFFVSDFIIELNSFAPEIFILGLITMILLLISAVSNIITANNYRRERRHFTEVKKKMDHHREFTYHICNNISIWNGNWF